MTADVENRNGVMEYELMDVSVPIPYKLNSKIHSEQNIKELMASISTQGLTYPISVDKHMVIIGGHGRLEACKRLGMKMVKVQVLAHLDEQGAKKARIAENKTASTEYDSTLMLAELQEINLDDLNVAELGFTDAEFEKLTMTFDEIDVEAFTEDLNKDVDNQTAEAEHDIKLADLKLTPVINGLGFKMVTVDATRKIARFVANLQEQYDLEDPAQAFVRFVEEMESA